MINIDLNSVVKEELKTIEEGTNIPVTITYVSNGTQSLKGEKVDNLIVTLKDKNEAKLYYKIPLVDSFAWKIRDLFISAGLSAIQDGKEIITTQEEYELVGKQILIDTAKNGHYTNVTQCKSKTSEKKTNKSENQAAIEAQAPSGKKLKKENPLPEFEGKLKENLDF